MDKKFLQKYLLYILRWEVAAIPGAWLLGQVQGYLSLFPAMLVTQGLLGAIVFWVDKYIIEK